MSADGCCQATIACFKDNADCASLQTCMAACGSTGTGTGTGPTTDAGTGTPVNTVAMNNFTTNVYPLLAATCASCHGAVGPGPTVLRKRPRRSRTRCSRSRASTRPAAASS